MGIKGIVAPTDLFMGHEESSPQCGVTNRRRKRLYDTQDISGTFQVAGLAKPDVSPRLQGWIRFLV